MAIKARATITLVSYRDTESVTRFYKLQSSTLATPSKPTVNPPTGWDDREPAYTSGSTNTLYFCELTEFSDGTYLYSEVSKSSSYEAAKEAYNKAQNAQNTANTAKTYTDAVSNQFGYRYKHDIIIYGDRTDLYYPVYFAYGNQSVPREVLITRGYSEQAPSDWNTSTHKGGLTLRIKANYGAWGGAEYKCEILDLSQLYCTMVADIRVSKLGGHGMCVWLRGGGSTGALYHIYSDQRIAYDSNTTWHANIPIIATSGSGQQIGWYLGTEDNPTYKWTSDAPMTNPDINRLNELQALKAANNAAKTATNFFELTDTNGLVVGDLTAGTLRGNVQLKAETGGASISLRDGSTNLAKFSAVSKAFSGVTTATTSTSSATESEEGEAGSSSTSVTSASQTITNNQTKSVVKIESSQPVYFSQGIRTNGVTVNDDSLISNVDMTLNGRIFDKSGRSAFEPNTGEGNLSIGYGRFKAATTSSTDSTILYGNKVKIATKNGMSVTQNGSSAFETNNSNGNATFGYHLKKKGSGDLNLYGGDNVNITAKSTRIVDQTGSASFEAKNDNGNTVVGYSRYSNGGNTNIYAGTELNLITNNGNVRTKSSIIPDTNANIALGKYNELGWSNIYIGNASGVYNGLRVIVDGSSKNLCGRDGSGHVIFGDNGSVMHYIAKNVSETATGNAFRFTSGNNDAKNNTTSIWLFGAADSTSRYIGSYLAYNRTYSSAANMVVTGNGVFGRSTSSSKRYKTNIKMANIDELKGLYNLPVKKFKYKDDYISEDDELYGKDVYGFIVEDLEDILPCAVQHIKDENGNDLPEMWNSNVIIPALLGLIQDLNDRIKALENKI